MTAFRNHAEEIAAAMRLEDEWRSVVRLPHQVQRQLAKDGWSWVGAGDKRTIAPETQHRLVGYLAQADAFARANPPAEQLDNYGRVKVTQ